MDDELSQPYTWRNVCRGFEMMGPDAEDHLALFLVNRQIFQEAMPVFYQNKLFHLWDVFHLSGFLSGMPARRLSQLGHLAFNYNETNLYWSPATDKIRGLDACDLSLAAMVTLNKLEVNIDEARWMEMPEDVCTATGRTCPLTNASDIPGMQALAIMARKARKLEVFGVCPLVKEYLKGEHQQAVAADSEAANEEWL